MIPGAAFDVKSSRKPLVSALGAARKRVPLGHAAVIDVDGRALTYDDLLKGAFALSGPLTRGLGPGETVGILLPTGAGAIVSMLAVTAAGRAPAMLNFTAGPANMASALRTARVKRIATARRFVEMANQGDAIRFLEKLAEVVYLEDVRANLTKTDKARAAAGMAAPGLVTAGKDPDAPAVILFTSGTEGEPKGVVLSHANIVGNVAQIISHIAELYPTDVFFNPLPTFHSFGLTGGVFLPLLAGVTAVQHPTPLQAKEIAKRIADTHATILLGTDTFVSQYARAGKDGELSRLRFAVCGAERVKDETRALLKRRYQVALVEGYGATEAAPVVSLNQPSANRPGSVGRVMPGVELRFEPVPGIAADGRLYVKGPNVMLGYMRSSAPGVIEPLPGGWHDTGDVCSIDADGFLRIEGRVKRFAKIGGEMVSLAVVENCATSLWPDGQHAAVTAPDPRKGEHIVLLSDVEGCDRADYVAFVQNHGVTELAIPRRIVKVDAIPLLGSGKVDYVGVAKALAAADARAAEAATAAETAATAAAVVEADAAEKAKRKPLLTRKPKPAAAPANGAAEAEHSAPAAAANAAVSQAVPAPEETPPAPGDQTAPRN